MSQREDGTVIVDDQENDRQSEGSEEGQDSGTENNSGEDTSAETDRLLLQQASELRQLRAAMADLQSQLTKPKSEPEEDDTPEELLPVKTLIAKEIQKAVAPMLESAASSKLDKAIDSYFSGYGKANTALRAQIEPALRQAGITNPTMENIHVVASTLVGNYWLNQVKDGKLSMPDGGSSETPSGESTPNTPEQNRRPSVTSTKEKPQDLSGLTEAEIAVMRRRGLKTVKELEDFKAGEAITVGLPKSFFKGKK
jgi:hypothetical protein